MKLQLEMLRESDGVSELKGDVVEMEHMLEGYLAFARGEGGEAPGPVRLDTLLDDVVAQAGARAALSMCTPKARSPWSSWRRRSSAA